MSDRRRGLGRGLGALIPQGPGTAQKPASPGSNGTPSPSPVDVLIPGRSALPRAVPPGPAEPALDASPVTGAPTDPPTGAPTDPPTGATFAELPLDAITPNPRQPREVFDEESLAELAYSIREVGLLQPVVVRETAPRRYELVMGERRWRAARDAGLERIPAIVRSTSDSDLLRDALLENLHRTDLNPLEEAAAYDQLLQDFGCTHDDLAQRIGRSRPQISNTLRLLRLPPPVQRRIAAGILSAGHARALLGLDDAAAQERLAQRIVAEGLSVRAVEEIVSVGATADDLDAARPPAARPSSPRMPGLEDVAARLADRFETRVKVDLGRTKGKIVVEFASIDDLERIIGIMAPPPDRPARDAPSGAADLSTA